MGRRRGQRDPAHVVHVGCTHLAPKLRCLDTRTVHVGASSPPKRFLLPNGTTSITRPSLLRVQTTMPNQRPRARRAQQPYTRGIRESHIQCATFPAHPRPIPFVSHVSVRAVDTSLNSGCDQLGCQSFWPILSSNAGKQDTGKARQVGSDFRKRGTGSQSPSRGIITDA